MLRLLPRLLDECTDTLTAAGLPAPLSRVLWARGVRTPEEADAFLHPGLHGLHDPLGLHGMAAAVARVRAAIAGGERIAVYGDYDVDGVCATALLTEALAVHGADVMFYIPSRHREGYGLNAEAVRALAEEARLLITVDCGVTCPEEAALAASLGLDLIITDHHEPPERLPTAVAVVDPLLGDYPFRRLCGAGVAFKLVQALFGLEAAEPLLELAALATVADMVPLLGENRALTHLGLAQMQTTRRPGLRALLTVSGLEGKTIAAGHLGFQVAPRLNAGGRLRDAARGVELLLTDDPALAMTIAAELSEANAERQRMEADILAQADRWVAENVDFVRERVLVVPGVGWNTGVVGLVASKLAEKYAWPAVVLSETDGVCVGSARSVPGVNLHTALSRCADLFIRFGGHAQAAGMTLAAERVPQLRERLGAAIADIAEPDAFVPSAAYDLDISLREITIPLIEQMNGLAPMGFGNPAPVFRLTDTRVVEARGVGAEGRHLKLRLAQGAAAVDGIAFGQGAMLRTLPERVDVLFSPTVNEFQGRRSAQCEVSRLLPHAPASAFRIECLRRADDFDCFLLDGEVGRAPIADEALCRALIAQRLTGCCQGTLLTVSTLAGAQAWIDWIEGAGLSGRLDYCFGAPRDARRFNTLCALPEAGAGEGYTEVFALDGAQVRAAMDAFLPTDDDLRGLYRALRAGGELFLSEGALAQACGMRRAAVRLGLRAFDELGLVTYTPVPFGVLTLPPKKCSLTDSGTLRRARGQEEMA
ncbi:hypothetical protein FACS1894196_0560 [Clostridia bacterium]|nr:hypothetical protein FACS1894196_0560 [Clostridia bacterium]